MYANVFLVLSRGQLLTGEIFTPAIAGSVALDLALCGGLDIGFTVTQVVQEIGGLHFFLEFSQRTVYIVIGHQDRSAIKFSHLPPDIAAYLPDLQ